jgi:hypothetical protein
MARRDPDRRPVYRWLPGLQPTPAWRGWFLLTGLSRLPGYGPAGYAAGPMGITGVRPSRRGEAGLAVPMVSMLAACPGPVCGLCPALALIAAVASRRVGPL